MKGRRNRERYGITPLKFVEVWAVAWNQGKSLDDVVRQLSDIAGKQVTRKYVLARASSYRRQGVVTLKSFAKRDRMAKVAS